MSVVNRYGRLKARLAMIFPVFTISDSLTTSEVTEPDIQSIKFAWKSPKVQKIVVDLLSQKCEFSLLMQHTHIFMHT